MVLNLLTEWIRLAGGMVGVGSSGGGTEGSVRCAVPRAFLSTPIPGLQLALSC